MAKLYKLTLFTIFFVPLITCLQWLTKGKIIFFGDVWYVSYVATVICFQLGVAFVLWKFNRFFSIFLLVCLLSTMCQFSGGRIVFAQITRALLTLYQISFAFLTIYMISKMTRNQLKGILKAVVILFLIQGVYVVLQYTNLDPIFNGKGTYMIEGRVDDTVGFSGSHNQIGIFFATTAPLILAWCPYLIPLTIFGLWCSTTSAAMLGFVVTTLLVLPKKNKDYLAVLLFVLCVALGVFYIKFENVSRYALNERIVLWKHTIQDTLDGELVLTNGDLQKIVRKNSWFGYGLGNFKRLSPYSQKEYLNKLDPEREQTHVYGHAHNDYLEVFFELGKIGFVALLLIICHFFLSFWATKKTKILKISFLCILSQMICALAVFTVHTAVSAMLLVIFLGVYWGEWRHINE